MTTPEVIVSTTVVEVVMPPAVTVEVSQFKGEQGPPGATKLYVQETAPDAPAGSVWFQTNPDGTLKTIWMVT